MTTHFNSSGLGKQELDALADLITSSMGEQGHFRLLLEVCDPTKQPACESYLEVKPSKYGNGVFATKDIPKNTWVTLYPAHLIVDMRDPQTKVYGPRTVPEDPNYALQFKEGILIQGDPAHYGGMCYGHMLNDPFDSVELFDRATETTIGFLVKCYKDATEKANCEFRNTGRFMWIRSTKKIRKGQELLVPYGYKYWMKNVVHLIPK